MVKLMTKNLFDSGYITTKNMEAAKNKIGEVPDNPPIINQYNDNTR